MGTCFILSIAVAFLADSYIGRFKAVLFSAIIELLGLALLTIQAHCSKLRSPVCNMFDPTVTYEEVKGDNDVILFVALYSVALGAAGLKVALSSYYVDQFHENDPKEVKQMSIFFN